MSTTDELKRLHTEVAAISAALAAAGVGESSEAGALNAGGSNGGLSTLHLRRRPSLGAQSAGSTQSFGNGGGAARLVRNESGSSMNGGLDGSGYSSGEDLTSEEHLSLTRRTIKRSLSNSSIASVHRALR
jgi:hypothetical protein